MRWRGTEGGSVRSGVVFNVFDDLVWLVEIEELRSTGVVALQNRLSREENATFQ
jgi:hypothetical protein